MRSIVQALNRIIALSLILLLLPMEMLAQQGYPYGTAYTQYPPQQQYPQQYSAYPQQPQYQQQQAYPQQQPAYNEQPAAAPLSAPGAAGSSDRTLP
jgi:hypothetical protein